MKHMGRPLYLGIGRVVKGTAAYGADFRGLQSMDSAAARHIAEIMDALAEKEVASVTRVMPDPHKDIGLNILSQVHYGPDVTITTFDRLADAVQSIAAKTDSSPS